MSKNNKYATCKCCKQPMAPKNGCAFSHIVCKGKKYKRIKSGDASDLAHGKDKDIICHDCNAGVGQYHHFGCDAETCPICGEQLFCCGCRIERFVQQEEWIVKRG